MAQWLALVTRDVVLPAIKEELAELLAAEEAGDPAAMARFQALNREAKAIEARAKDLSLTFTEQVQGDDLVA